MILDRIYSMKHQVKKPWEYQITLDRNHNTSKEDRMQISNNIHELIFNMFCLSWKPIVFENTFEWEWKKEKLFQNTTFYFDPWLDYLDWMKEWNVIVDKNLLEFYKKWFWEQVYYSDWINRLFYKIDSSIVWEFTINDQFKDECDLLTYLFSLRVLSQSLVSSKFYWSEFYKENNKKYTWFWDIVFNNNFYEQYFTKDIWFNVLTPTILNFDWKIVEKYFFWFLDKYKVDYDVVYKFFESAIQEFWYQRQLEYCWKYVVDKKLYSVWNYYFLFLIYKMLHTEETWFMKWLWYMLTTWWKDSLEKLYDDLITFLWKFWDRVNTDDYKMFMLCIELMMLYHTAYVSYFDQVRFKLDMRWYRWYSTWYKFFNFWYLDIFRKLLPWNWKEDNSIVSKYKRMWKSTQCKMTQEEFDEKYKDWFKISSEAYWDWQWWLKSPLLWSPLRISIIPAKTVLEENWIYDDEDDKEKYMWQEEEIQDQRTIQNEENTSNWTIKRESITSKMIYDKLREEIVWQDWILKVISKKIYSYLVLKKTNNAPLSLFLVWPSWSWKSYLSSVIVKVLNELFFNSEDVENKFVAQEELISKYNTKETISALLWTTTWYQWAKDKIPFFETLLESKNQIILFDEMEKWTSEIFRFFLDFMNNWKMESMSKKYWITMWESNFELKTEFVHNLDNVIFIFASNAIISENVASELSWKKYKKSKSIEEYESNFSYNNNLLYQALTNYRSQNWWIIDPAFIDRLDSIYLFNELTEENKIEILKKKFLKELQNYNISENWKENVISYFEKDFKKWWKWYEDMKHYESMRWFNRYIWDWISSTIEKYWIN